MLLRKKQPVLTREQSMAAVPIRNPMLTVERDDGDLENLSIPRKEAWWVKLLVRVVYIPKHRRLALDRLGSTVWDLCDGQNTVRTVIDKFSKEYKLNRKEAEISMVTYLKQLAKKGIIGLQVPKDLPSGGQQT